MKRKSRFSFLLLAGVLLLAAGLIGLSTVPDLMQYAFLPEKTGSAADSSYMSALPADDMDDYTSDDPDESQYSGSQTGAKENENSTPLLERYDEIVYPAMGEMFPRLTLHSIKSSETVSLENGRSETGITLYAVGPVWNEVYTPKIIKGRPIDRIDAEKKAKVIVLDEKIAFSLFIDKDPLGETVKFDDGTELEVVGIAQHSRRIGETGLYAAWVPLDLITNSELMVLSAHSTSMNMFAMFRTQAQSYYTGGTAISLTKEKNRAILPLLLVFVVVAFWLLKRWMGWLTGYCRIQIEKVKAEGKRRYLMKLLPYAAGQLLPMLLLIVVTVAAYFALAVVVINPIRIFPEWLPETLGEYTSWIERFWTLVGTSAQPVTMKTPELTEVQFWSNLILWGTILIVLRAAKQTLTGFLRKKED